MAPARYEVVSGLRSSIERIERESGSGKGGARVGSGRCRGASTRAFPSDADEVDGAEQVEKAYQKILRCVSVREQSSLRMRAKLAQAGFEPSVADAAIEQACRVRAIDDARYADALVRSTLSSGRGLALALREVEELGIDPYALDAYCDYLEAATDSETTRALAVLAARPPRAKNKQAAAYRKLVSKGFSSEVAADAARQWARGNA